MQFTSEMKRAGDADCRPHLAAIRMLFDWLVTGQVVAVLVRWR
jgi:hypothetical protein